MATQEVIYDAGVVESAPDVVELALVAQPDAIKLFEDKGLDPIIGKIREEVKKHISDISTERGRKAIASLARKVASSKVRLDDLGKELVTGVKAQIATIDGERRRMRDELDSLRDETRQPLTEWENIEASRIEAHEEGLRTIASLANVPFNSPIEEITDRLEDVQSFVKRDWQEFARRYQMASESAISQLSKLLDETKRRAEEQAELQRLQAAEAKRLQEERDARLQAEAAARATAEAQSRARREAEAEERRQHEAAAKAKQESEARIKKIEEDAAKAKAEAERKAKAEREEVERKAKAAAAEAQRQHEAADKARRDAEERTRRAEEAAAKAAKDAELATQRERDRVAEEKRKEAEVVAKREANRKHVNAVNDSILNALVSNGIPESWAEKTVTLLALQQIPNVRITY